VFTGNIDFCSFNSSLKRYAHKLYVCKDSVRYDNFTFESKRKILQKKQCVVKINSVVTLMSLALPNIFVNTNNGRFRRRTKC